MAIAPITNQVLMIKSMKDENKGVKMAHGGQINPIRPGEVRNPTGRPKGSGLKLDDVLNDMLERDVDVHQIIKDKHIREAMGLGSRAKVAQVVTAIVLRQAFEGKKYAVELLFDRNSGKAKQDVTVNQGEVSSMTDAELDARLAELMHGQRIVDVSDAITQPEVGINAAIDGLVTEHGLDGTPTTRVEVSHDDNDTQYTVVSNTVDSGA